MAKTGCRKCRSILLLSLITQILIEVDFSVGRLFYSIASVSRDAAVSGASSQVSVKDEAEAEKEKKKPDHLYSMPKPVRAHFWYLWLGFCGK